MKKRRRSQLNQVVDKPLYFKVDKKIKKLASTQQLQSRKSKLLFLALVFEDQSYVIIDQSGTSGRIFSSKIYLSRGSFL